GSGQRESWLRYSAIRIAVASSAGVAIGGLGPPFIPASASRIARTPAARKSRGEKTIPMPMASGSAAAGEKGLPPRGGDPNGRLAGASLDIGAHLLFRLRRIEE